MSDAAIRNRYRDFADCLSKSSIELGMAAYQGYHDIIRELAKLHGFGFVQSVEAFAALSPNNDYIGNLRSLVSCMTFLNGQSESCTVTTFNSARDRAISYLSGEVSFLDTVGGKKITCFRDNILYVEFSKRATVDGHMIAIGLGKDLTMKEANFELRNHGYDCFEKALISASRSVGMAPCQYQASLWHQRKLEKQIVSSHLEQLDFWKTTDGTPLAEEIKPYA